MVQVPRRVKAFARNLREDGWRLSIVIAIPIAICAYLTALWLEGASGQDSAYDHVTYIAITALFAALELLLIARKVKLTTAVMLVLVAVSAQFAGKLLYLLYFNPRPENTLAEFTETFFWLPAVFMLASFIPGLKRGRLMSTLFFVVFAVISVLYVVPNWLAGQNFGIIYALIQLSLANVTLLALTDNFLGFKENLTRTSERAETMERLAYSDSLTALPNRLALEQDLTRLIAERPPETKIAVAFVDIDGFKLVNDSRGHAVGDALLSHFATRLGSIKREGDSVYRISGDEFVVLFSRLPANLNISGIGRRVSDMLEAPFDLGKQPLDVSASIGIALCPNDGEAAATLLKHADAAMYTVKHSGKNGVAFYEAGRDQFFEDRVVLVSELQAGLRDETLEVHYQPIVNVTNSLLVKVEALVRWQSPTVGDVSPRKFIALAEEHGLIQRLGEFVLNTACGQIKRWEQQGINSVVVCVNVSAHQLQDPGFVPMVSSVLEAAVVAPHKLELELTESAVIHAYDQVTDNLRKLRRLGVSIALDDFGTGYSSLSYLETLDFDTIKIDRSFATKLTHNRQNPQYATAIIRAVLEIAKSLEVEVVAEGVETKEQLDMFRSLGCELLQGYYFGEPMPVGDITELLQKFPAGSTVGSFVRPYN